MAVRIQLRRDTAANWVSANPTLRAGEIGIETDTLKFKVGNGSSTWTQITAYANVTPSSLTSSLSDYILAADQGTPGGPAELDSNGDLIIPENSIILWNDAAHDYTSTITATEPTADRTITLPNASGTVALVENVAALSGATFTGNISLPTAITFEGATADSYETTIQVTDPTADRTITFPDAAGTVALTSNIPSTTDNLSEGSSNKYFTDERAQDAVATALSNGTHTNITVSYDDNANSISLTGSQTYSDENARDAAAGLITGSTHDGVSVSYTDDGSNAGTLAFTNTDKGSSQNIFKNIVVGATTVVADSNNDTLTIVGSNGVGALANATNDVIEIYNTGVTSLTGTANEVEVDTTTGAVIVGLPNNVTISGNLTLSNSPTQASHAATKAYVDNTTAGLNFHAPAHAATTANLTATYDNGTSGVGATLTGSGAFPQIDGHTVTEQQRVLVKDQSTASQNGLYVLTDDGDPSGSWVLTRATDADNSPAGEIAYGDFCFIQNGGQAGYGFIVNTTGTITIGTTSISYIQFNAGQVVIAGNGLQEATPGTLSIDTSVTADVSTAQTFTNKTLTSPKINEDVALTATATELNTLDGITASTAELNILDGATLSTTELNYVDGVTSSIQTQLDSKLSTSTASSTYQPLVSGVSNTEIGYLDGVTSSIQTQLDGKVDESLFDTKGDILVASGDNTPAKLAAGTNGYILTANSSATNGIEWAAAPISLPSQSGNNGKYLTTDGSTASWGTVSSYSAPTIGSTSIASGSTVTSIAGLTLNTTSTTSITSNSATTIDTNALSGFTTVKYIISIKQGSKIRSSEVIAQTDGTSVDYAEFGVIETGGPINGILVAVSVSSTNCILRITISDAASTNATVKIQKVLI